MQNYQHANRSNFAKVRINKKPIMQQKRYSQTQPPSQPTIDSSSQYAEYDSKTCDIPCSTRNELNYIT